MAGIGFKLTRILEKQSYASMLHAYGYAALISSGPWVISILSLALLGAIFGVHSKGETKDLFFVSVTNIYAYSLILTGPLQLILTRYAADCLYIKERSKIFPAYLTALAITAGVTAILGIVLFGFLTDSPLLVRLSSAGCFVAVSCIWISSIFLTAVKHYHRTLCSFAVGYGMSFLLAWGFTAVHGDDVTMAGYAIGQFILLLAFISLIYHEFGNARMPNYEFLGYFRKFRYLALCGLFYNLGIWSDKLLHWYFAYNREQINGWLYASPFYDEALYLSFLSVTPGMAVFFLMVETRFALHYEQFFRLVSGKAPFQRIHDAKEEMMASQREGLAQMVKVQGFVTLASVLLADQILSFAGLGSVQTVVFQTTLIGVFLLVLFMAFLTTLFYLDRIFQAYVCCGSFLLTNVGVTLLTLQADERWYGLGFVTASAVGMLTAACYANFHLRNLEYETFTSQPV